MELTYKRILLKISGEVLAGGKGMGIDYDTVLNICSAVKECVDMGVQVGLVVGGGNFWRGRSSGDMDRTRADHMGMLATVMNSLALAYIRNKAVRHLEKGRVVIFGCGTGNPFFTTDTAAALRALEIDADIMFKATNVDGVYDKDPHKFEDAKKYDTLSFDEILSHDLKVMDGTAASLCRDNSIPILVFNLDDPQNIVKAIKGENVGTVVK